jgi:hypothetical protein
LATHGATATIILGGAALLPSDKMTRHADKQDKQIRTRGGRMKLFRTALVSLVLASLAVQGSAAMAATDYTLQGDATIVAGGNPGNAAQLRSDADSVFGLVDFDVSGLTFAQLTELATDFNVTNDQCGGGSPRFQINVQTASGTENIFVYLGPSPTFTGCAPATWQSSGNLIGNNDACRWDTSQLAAGTQCSTYTAALASFGTLPITGIQLVVDAGWSAVASVNDGEQTVLVDNVRINGDVITFDEGVEPGDKEKCKKGGWMDFTASPGPFKNQGDCVSYFATGGKNKASE